MASRWKHVKPIMGYDWIIKSKHSTLDLEYQKYNILASKQKFEKQLEKGRIDNLYEVIFQMLNLNTLALSGKIFNEEYKEVDDPILKDLWNNFTNYGIKVSNANKEGKKLPTPSPAFVIMQDAREMLMEVMMEYFNTALLKVSDFKLLFNNNQLHTEPHVYALINVKGYEYYDIWEIIINDSPYGKFRRIETLNSNHDNINDTIININKNQKIPLCPDNTIIVELKNSHDHSIVAGLVRDIIMLNRFFMGFNESFDKHILENITATIESKKTFPFSLVSNN